MKNSGRYSKNTTDHVCTNCPFGQPCRSRGFEKFTRCEWSAKIIRKQKTPVDQICKAMKASVSAKILHAHDGVILVQGCTSCDYIKKII